WRRDGVSEHVRHFRRGTLLDWYLLAACQREIEGGDGSRDEEWHAVLLGQHRHGVGADLVGDIAIARDAVRAHHYTADAPALHEMARHVVRDERGRNAVLLQLPHGEARALQKGARLIGEDVDLFARL